MTSNGKGTCCRNCEKFKVKKPSGMGRYEAGQANCRICDVWIDYRGAHLKDGTKAIKYSTGWYCNCCNYRVRQHPRNKIYKEKLRETHNYRVMQHLRNKTVEKRLGKLHSKRIMEIDLKLPANKVELHELKNSELQLKKFLSSQTNILEECELLIKNYKKRRVISEHNVELMDDMIDVYQQFGSLRKLCQEIDLDISSVRNDFRNLLRVPTELSELVNNNKLISGEILAIEIAIHATDCFDWDQEESKTKDVVTLAKNMAQIFKDNLNLRSEFFTTKDDYDKPISASAKKNNEHKAILEE